MKEIRRKRATGEFTATGRKRRSSKPIDRALFLYPLLGEAKAIYVMEIAGDAVKIGISNDPTNRRSSVQNGNSRPVRLSWWAWLSAEDAFAAEQEIHRQLGATLNSAAGEWYFMSCDTAIASIERVLNELCLDYWDDRMFRMMPWEWNAIVMQKGLPYLRGYNCGAG